MSQSMQQYRDDFPILSRETVAGVPLAFLDNAASSQRPTAVIEAIAATERSIGGATHRSDALCRRERTLRPRI